MTLTKNTNYTDKTDAYLTYTYNGKSKKVTNVGITITYYQFIEKAANPNNTWLKPRNVYKSESWVKDYFEVK